MIDSKLEQQINLTDAPSEIDKLNRTDDEAESLEQKVARYQLKTAQLEEEIAHHRRLVEELRTQRKLFLNLMTVAQATAEEISLEQVMQNVMEVVMQLTAAERGSLLLFDERLNVSQSIFSRRNAPPLQTNTVKPTIMTKGVAGWVVRHCQPVLIHDTFQDGRWVVIAGEPFVTRSVLSVPILNQHKVIGVLTLQHSIPHHFTGEHTGLMQAAADQMSLGIRNARLYTNAQHEIAERKVVEDALRISQENLHHQNEYLLTLYQITLDLLNRYEVNELLQVIIDRAAALLDAPYGELCQVEGDVLIVRAFTENQPFLAGDRVRRGEGAFLTWQAYDTQRVVLMDNYSSWSGKRPIYDSLQFHATAEIPIIAGQKCLGVLSFSRDQSNYPFTPEQVQVGLWLAHLAALVLDNAHLYHRLEQQLTEQTLEHGRLQALIQSSRDGIILISLNRRVLVINEMALNLLSLTGTPEMWVNKPLLKALKLLKQTAPAVVKATRAELQRIQQGNEVAGEGEYMVASRAIHWRNLPVMVEAHPIGRLLILRDVTQERLLDKMRKDLTNMLVHDLRNPLGAVFTGLDLLNQTADMRPADRRVLQLAQNNLNQGLQMINAILDISRLESGDMPINGTMFSLNLVIDEVVSSQATLITNKQVQLIFDSPQELPKVWADPSLIDRVLRNLVGNAIKFTPRGGKICLFATADPTTLQVLVSVRDTGPGIPPEVQSRLFERFVAGRQKERGNGLGLAFCKMALEAHHQRIWVAETSKAGTTITFSLATTPDTFPN